MPTIGQTERATQNRVIALFRDELAYRTLGDWTDRLNSNVEVDLLTAYLSKRGYSPAQIGRALDRLRTEASNPNRSLYDNNQAVLLRYGVQVQAAAGENTETVWLIDWNDPVQNDFAVAEEVTLHADHANAHERRPDVVLYVNGIAVGVLELKNSRVSIGHGIRQSISNQQPEFNAWFFSTVQFVFAGNDSEGLQYGAIATGEKYFLKWKEDEADNSRFKLDKYLLKMCNKARLIELMHDFVLFDGGIKKLPRVHQYFGIKAAQGHVHRREGGIVWHTQGSGKSIVMVLLAKWILENQPNARVAIVTDRDELDKQIEGVFIAAGYPMTRVSSGRDLMSKLEQATPRLLCSLVHKFGKKGVDDFEQFIKELEAEPSPTVGELFVFVDECHRTQSGKLHRTMKALMRACANISDDLARAGYSDADILRIQQTIDRYLKLREIIRNAADEKLDMKAYEADMRHLIDTYIEASEPRTISPFDDMPLLELIVRTGIAGAIDSLPAGLKGNKEAVAETIENNVRSKIVKEHLNDPAYYARMSALLDEIVAARKARAIEYEEYLKQVAELAKRVEAGQAEDTPKQLDTPGRRALYNLLREGAAADGAPRAAEPAAHDDVAGKGDSLAPALKIDETVKHTRPDGWRSVQAKENVIKAALYGILQDVAEVERIFLVIRQQKEY